MTDLESVGFIDQTLYANEGNRPGIRWTNTEVCEMLREIRALIIADVEPELLGLAELADLAFGRQPTSRREFDIVLKPLATNTDLADAPTVDPDWAKNIAKSPDAGPFEGENRA